MGPEHMRKRFSETSARRLGEMTARLSLGTEAIEAHRREALRAVLSHATTSSPGWRERLSGIDAASITVAKLAAIPTLTKDELMADWNELVCAPGLSLEQCRRRLGEGAVAVDDEHLAIASSGSSGQSAVMVYSIDEAVTEWAAYMRLLVRWAATQEFDGPPTTALVGAPPGPHMSAMLGWLQGTDESARFSVGDTHEALIDGLSRIDPELLVVYPSVLPRLLQAADEGALSIAPKLVVTIAEPTADAVVDAVSTAWGCPVSSNWAATEVGMLGTGDPAQPGIVLHDDHVIIERVDSRGVPVPAESACEKVFVTTLTRRAFPLIRYEITDQLEQVESLPGSGFTTTAAVSGRADDAFRFGEAVVHPAVVRAELAAAEALDYQVHQRPDGICVEVVPGPSGGLEELGHRLRTVLERSGVAGAVVDVVEVRTLEADAATGKLRRFVPMSA